MTRRTTTGHLVLLLAGLSGAALAQTTTPAPSTSVQPAPATTAASNKLVVYFDLGSAAVRPDEVAVPIRSVRRWSTSSYPTGGR